MIKRRLLAIAMLAGLAACSNADDPRAALARGEQALATGEARTARIEFLNAIKADPNNPRLRLLQAETYLKLGDAVAAEAELRRARQLGAMPAQTHHLLAHAYLLQGRHWEAVAESRSAPAEHRAYASRILGQAQMKLGAVDEATQAFDAAAAAAPNDPAVWTDTARFRRSIGDMAGALAAADRAVKAQPDHVEAVTLRGELTRTQYGLAAALPWFDRALEVDETDTAARLERAATLAEMGEMSAMLADTREVLESAPAAPMAYHLQAALAARAGKFSLARSLHQKTNGVMDDQPAGMLLAAAIELQTGATVPALARLERLTRIQPENRKARRLLATAYWKQGDAAATIRTLQPLADRPGANTYTLTLLAQAYRKQGDTPRAGQLLARRASQRSPYPAFFASGTTEGQLDRLRNLAEAEPNDVQPQVLLIGALLSRGEAGEALDRARTLQAQNPGAPDAHLLVGDALASQGDHADAAQQYRRAANLSFTEPVALRLHAALRRSAQEPAAARVLQLFLEQNPRNVPARLLAANRFMELRRWSAAISLYEGLRSRLGDRDTALLNNVAYAYGRRGQYERAIPLAQKAWRIDTDNPATTDTLGWLLLKSGKDRARGLALIAQASRPAVGQP